jgi:hypothetical protein
MDNAQAIRRPARVAANLIIPAAFAVLAMIPTSLLDHTPQICVYRNLFGIRCPGCGMMHAFCSILHGHFWAAWKYNPLVIAAFPFFTTRAVRNLATVARMLAPLRQGQGNGSCNKT